MSERDQAIAPPTLAYATPADAPPRPAALLWVAATFVWLGSVPVALLALVAWVACLIQLEPVGTLSASIVFLIAAELAWLQWRAIFARSVSAAEAACAIAVIGAAFCAIVDLISLATILGDRASRSDADAWTSLAVAFGATALLCLTAVANGRWANRLRWHAARERP